MNNLDTKILSVLLQISRVINSTPVPEINQETTREQMGDYHRKLRGKIKYGEKLSCNTMSPLELINVKKKKSRHRKYIYQLTGLLTASINIVALELHTHIRIDSEGPKIFIEGNYAPIPKKIFNGFLKQCLIGITGDSDILADFRRVKSKIVRTSFRDMKPNEL